MDSGPAPNGASRNDDQDFDAPKTARQYLSNGLILLKSKEARKRIVVVIGSICIRRRFFAQGALD